MDLISCTWVPKLHRFNYSLQLLAQFQANEEINLSLSLFLFDIAGGIFIRSLVSFY